MRGEARPGSVEPRALRLKPMRWEVRSSALWCGSVQVENHPACYRVAPSARKTLNLTCRSFGLWPTSANPIFVFFVAFVVKIIRIGTVPTSRHRHRVQWPVRSQSRKLDSTVRSCRGEVPNPEPEKP